MDCIDLADYGEDLKKYTIYPQDIVIGMSGSIKIGINNTKRICYLNQRVGKFLPHSEYLNFKFLYYFLFYSLTTLTNGKFGGTVKNLSNHDINKIKIPVPPLPIQQEIVRILDHFEMICNDLTAGLPAEIEARQKQYEYYRDKLLTFAPAQ